MDPPSGRSGDMITLPCGTKVSYLRLEVSLRHEMDLLQYRFVQERLDRIQAQLCFRRAPTPAKLAELRRRMEEAAGGNLAVDIELIPEMKFEGVKFKVFVSKL